MPVCVSRDLLPLCHCPLVAAKEKQPHICRGIAYASSNLENKFK